MTQTRGMVALLSILALCFWVSVARAQEPPTPLVEAVEAVGMTVGDMERSKVLASKFALVSPGVVTLTHGQLGFQKGLLVRDLDGHAVQVIEK
jgi:hypothetical protein